MRTGREHRALEDQGGKIGSPVSLLAALNNRKARRSGSVTSSSAKEKLERAKGFEPSTPTLARLCSLFPLSSCKFRMMPVRSCSEGEKADYGSACIRVLPFSCFPPASPDWWGSSGEAKT